MANNARWTVDVAFTSILTTQLNSLASAGVSALSAAITNGTSLSMLMDISLILGSITPSGSGPFVEIHMSPLQGDGSTYANVFAGGPTLVGVLGLSAGASIKAASLLGVQLPPGSYELALVNQAGVALASSGNTMYYRLYTPNLNG
jgi:hypothetical protein